MRLLISFCFFACPPSRNPRGNGPLLDSLSCNAVLQLSTSECLHVVSGLLASVRMVVVSNAVVKMRSSIRSGFSNRERAEGSESYQLEHDPRRFITRLYHLLPSDSLASEPSSFMELPTYVVTYSTIGAEIRSLLADTNFVEVRLSWDFYCTGQSLT